MLDPKILKENPVAVREMLKKRKMTDFPIDELTTLYKLRGDLIIKTQELRRQKNLLSETVAGKGFARRVDCPPLSPNSMETPANEAM